MKGDDRSEVTLRPFMTASPHCIGVDQTLALAAERMADYGIRHLPVLDGGQLVGIVSERDLALIASVVPDKMDTLKVEEAMAGVPYCADVDTPIAAVAGRMAARKLGSAVVTEGGKVVGVFTTTDALRLLEMLLAGTLPQHAAHVPDPTPPRS